MTLWAVIAALYASEINVLVRTFWDAGIEVHLGDDLNGWKDSANFGVGDERAAVLWLDRAARQHFQNSSYAKTPPLPSHPDPG